MLDLSLEIFGYYTRLVLDLSLEVLGHHADIMLENLFDLSDIVSVHNISRQVSLMRLICRELYHSYPDLAMYFNTSDSIVPAPSLPHTLPRQFDEHILQGRPQGADLADVVAADALQ